MFEFERLDVYVKAKAFNLKVIEFLGTNDELNRFEIDQLKRASLSVVLNIAEGSSSFSKAGKRNFYMIARGSAFECVAVSDVLQGQEKVNPDIYQDFYLAADEVSRMLFGLIRKLGE